MLQIDYEATTNYVKITKQDWIWAHKQAGREKWQLKYFRTENQSMKHLKQYRND